MGVKKLFTYLNNKNLYKVYPYLNDIINEIGIDKKKLLVGVDGNLFCYKYTHSYDNMLIGFFNQILKFLSNKIIPLYIFDGGTIQEKENTNLIRYHKKIMCKYKLEQLENILESDNEQNSVELLLLRKKLEKNSTKINGTNILILLELLDLLNIPYIFSYGEGEYLAVLLNKYNIIDFFLTDDTDPIPGGIIKTIKFYNNSVYYLQIDEVLEKLNMNQEQLIDFCVLLGSDYAHFYHGLKYDELYNLLIKYKNIENIYLNNKLPILNEESFILINKIRNIYKNSYLIEKDMFINKKNDCENINFIIDHSNISYYSNIMLEYWDEFIEILSINNDTNETNTIIITDKTKIQVDNFKNLIYKHISKLKFNIKNIVKFIRNNINDITDEEISNMVMSFDFLNTFGI